MSHKHVSDAELERSPGCDSVPLDEARGFAAEMLMAAGRPDLAEIVRAGRGDDFAEVQAAARLLARFNDRVRRQEEALRVYADPNFWDDDELPGGALALHDKGEMARNVLAGRRPFFHPD